MMLHETQVTYPETHAVAAAQGSGAAQVQERVLAALRRVRLQYLVERFGIDRHMQDWCARNLALVLLTCCNEQRLTVSHPECSCASVSLTPD